MRTELTLSTATLYGFLLVLARVGGALVFVPLPGAKALNEPARAAFVLAFTLALFGRWPHVNVSAVDAGVLVKWILQEAAIGIAIGVAVAIVLEAFAFSAQVLGIQAGYAYASTIDPNTEADSGVLLVFAQLCGAMLFFATGLDREVLRLFAESLERIPPGTASFASGSYEGLVRLGANMLGIGVRLALPVVALLVLVDVALALLGRLNSQLQLLSVAFPLKMAVALLILSWVVTVYPRILSDFGATALHTLRAMGI